MAATQGSWPSLVRPKKGQVHPTGWVRVFQPGAGEETARNVGTGHGRGVLAVGKNAVWVTNGWSETVTRLDRPSLEASVTANVHKPPVAAVVGPRETWVLCANGWLWRFPHGGEQIEGVTRLGSRACAVATTDAWVWVLRKNGSLIRLEPSSGEETLRTSIGRGAWHLIEHDGALWATSARGHRLVRIDGDSGEIVAESKPPRRIVCLVVDHGTAWIGCRQWSSGTRGWLYSADATTLAWGEPLVLDGRPRALASGLGAVWVASADRGEHRGTIDRFDLTVERLENFAETAWPVYDLATCGDSVLATMGLSTASNLDAGGRTLDRLRWGGGVGDGDGEPG
jgi:hypothetical protein